MSNEFAIAAVTLTLRNLLEKVKLIKDGSEFDSLPADAKPSAEILVTNLPLDTATGHDPGKNLINLFLYHLEYSPSWRNMDIPGSVKRGETGYPPLALNLHYIITVYGENGNELIAHVLLGKAMSILHDHAVFGRSEIKTAFEVSGLHRQIERVRITPQPISLDEVSKLWTGFQTHYRLTAAYEVSLVLIEATRAAKTPLPVLTRGAGDEGVFVQPYLVPPYPTLESVSLPNNQPAALPGDLLTLKGHHLQGDSVKLRFVHPVLSDAIEVTASPGGPEVEPGTEIKAQLPTDPANWPAGLYRVTAVISKTGEQDRTSNELPLMLAPGITGTVGITAASPPSAGAYVATVTCSPQVWPDQNASLLLGEWQFPADARQTKTGTLTFHLTGVTAGDYYVRLRVDGVDSLLIDYTASPPVFDASKKVTIP